MIVSEIFNGSGLGNQIWNYVVTKAIAKKNNYEYGIRGREKWKGKSFMHLDFGNEVVGGSFDEEGKPPTEFPNGISTIYNEFSFVHPLTNGNVGIADPNIMNINDRTMICGNFQRLSYVNDYRKDIVEWLSYDDSLKFPKYTGDDSCVIQFRGGDYLTGNSYLSPEYYEMAMVAMKHITKNENLKFYCVTDDPINAKKFIPGVEIIGSAISSQKDPHQGKIGWYEYPGGPVGIDYAILNQAKNLIISASTFAFWPAWTNIGANVVAPMYWFDWSSSDGWWRPADSIVDDWYWINKDGVVDTGIECKENFEKYRKNNAFYVFMDSMVNNMKNTSPLSLYKSMM